MEYVRDMAKDDRFERRRQEKEARQKRRKKRNKKNQKTTFMSIIVREVLGIK
jgi:hypothetical protein